MACGICEQYGVTSGDDYGEDVRDCSYCGRPVCLMHRDRWTAGQAGVEVLCADCAQQYAGVDDDGDGGWAEEDYRGELAYQYAGETLEQPDWTDWL